MAGSFGQEKRRGERNSAKDKVRLILDDPGAGSLEIQGTLLDWSEGGFRMVHQFTGLLPGQEVRFRRAGAEGRARVVWNRLLPEHIESGFVVLEVID